MKFPIGMQQFQELRTDGWVYGDDALQADFRAALKAFYGTLKSADGDLRFTMLTGVTKFSKVSVFSDLNNLEDISMEPKLHDICGITEEELHGYFDEEVNRLAEENGQTKVEAYMTLRARYDGYHFLLQCARNI